MWYGDYFKSFDENLSCIYLGQSATLSIDPHCPET